MDVYFFKLTNKELELIYKCIYDKKINLDIFLNNYEHLSGVSYYDNLVVEYAFLEELEEKLKNLYKGEFEID